MASTQKRPYVSGRQLFQLHHGSQVRCSDGVLDKFFTQAVSQLAFYCASSLKQQSRVDMYPLYSDAYFLGSEPSSLCSYTLMFCTYQRSSEFQFYCLWFDPAGFKRTIYCTEVSKLTITPLILMLTEMQTTMCI